MSDIPITLGLPPLAPGEAPPACCPHCGAELTDPVDNYAEYACCARYCRNHLGEWFADLDVYYHCRSPRRSAVLAALRSRGEPAWQKVVVAQDGTESIMADWSEIDDGLEGAEDWFAKQGL